MPLFPKSLQRLIRSRQAIEPNSKIYFNIGLLHATRGEHERAIEAFESAIQLDPYLAVAYFQAGVSRFLLRQFDEARRDFDDAWLVSLFMTARVTPFAQES